MIDNIDFFSFRDSAFVISKNKAKSARVVFWKELGIEHSYTLEMSYCGYNKGIEKGQHHTQKGLGMIASGLLKSIWELEEAEREQLELR